MFQKWLLLFVALAFIATFGIAWYVHRKQAESTAPDLLTAEIPNSEVYDAGNMPLYILFFEILLIFGVIFILVSGLLQKLVINEISSVTDSLDEISKGNPDKTIVVAKSSELHKLAKSVNSTMQVLKKTLESDSKRVKAESGIAKLLQHSALTEHANYKIPAEMFAAAAADVLISAVLSGIYAFLPVEQIQYRRWKYG